MYDRYTPQARAAAILQTSPERRGLRALLLEAAAQKEADIRAARTSSRVLRSSIREADPRVAAVYDAAARGISAVTGDYDTPAARSVAGDFAQLGPAAASIAEAARAESEGALRRTSEAKARNRADLEAQRVRAAEGETFAVRAAQDRYRSDAAKVLDQLQGLDQEEGLFAATELGRLVEAARGRRAGLQKTRVENRQEERNSLRSAGINPDTGRPYRNGPLDPGKPKPKPKRDDKDWLPPSEQRSARKDFGSAKGQARRLRTEEGLSRSEVANLLLNGRSALKLSSGRVLPKVKAVTDETLVSAALDDVYDGRLSRRNQRRLYRQGIKIGQLGVTTYRDWVRQRGSNRTQRANDQRPADPKYGRG